MNWFKSIPEWVWLLLGLSVVIVVVANRIDVYSQRPDEMVPLDR